MAQFRKIGVLTSGGDAPGMNAAIRAVTLSAYAHGVEVVGIMKGYTGLISGELKELTPRDVANISGLSGTILYSDRCPEFKTEEGMAKAIKTCCDNHIDGIVAIGGDGTFRGATDLSIRGIPTIGLPGTIDNDITSSDYTIGFDTAMNTVVTCADNLRDTGESHARCMVMEVMGNGAGDIALNCGLAVGAVAIAIKELPFDEDAAIATIKAQRAKGQRSFIVMISESMGGEFGEALTKRIMAETGVDSRFVRLGHIVRGGAPSLRDRLTATRMGDYAVKLILKGMSNLVVVEQKSELVEVEIQYALMLDRMYKNKLKDGDLDKFTAEQVASAKKFCDDKRVEFDGLMDVAKMLASN